MIEIEQKFLLTTKQQEKLVRDAIFISETQFTDSYFDDDNYSLTTQDKWLRTRNELFELKKGFTPPRQTITQYKELNTEEAIAQELRLPTNIPLSQILKKNQYTIFCTCHTNRKKYQKDGFSIDIDTINYPETSWQYNIVEIELIVKTQEEVEEAIKKTLTFTQEYNLTSQTVRGKVDEYLYREKPTHYQKLVEASIIKNNQTFKNIEFQ